MPRRPANEQTPGQLSLFGQDVGGGTAPTGPGKGIRGRRATAAPHTPKVFTEDQQSRPGEWVTMSSSRVAQARFDYGTRHIDVMFVDGTPWTYEDVPYDIYRQFIRSASPGKFINRRLNSFPYRRGEFDT